MSRRTVAALLRSLLLLALVARIGAAQAAAEPVAVATLSQKEIAVGEDVELEIKVRGGSQLRWQGSLDVDGLEINGPRMESPMDLDSLLNGSGVGGLTLRFTITPTRAGEFTIPAIGLSVDGRAVKTDPVVLKVRPDGAGPKRLGGDQPALGIVDLVVPDGTFYVGQVIPVEIRLSGAASLRWQPEAMPELAGDGFTKVKYPEPQQQRGERNGEAMDVYVFRTAITPGRAGKLTLGPVTAPYVALVPRARERRSRSLFDDIFSDPTFAEPRHAKAHGEARELEVKPLPTAGRPESFSGGVGQLKFAAEGAPAKVKIGDPVTMKLTVTGSGNFDRVTAPVLKSSAGWRTYPPSADFRAGDDLGITGTKTFTVAVVPERPQKAMPVFEFSFFDPQAEKYVTLTSAPQPLAVEGGALPEPPVVSAPAENHATPSAEPSAPPDILGLRYDEDTRRRTFAPIFANRVFLAAQAVPAAFLLGWGFIRLRRTGEEERRRRACRAERDRVLARLRGAELADAEFLETATEVIRLETALATGRAAASVDAAFALASRPVDEETARGVERIFNARAELLYAGTGGGSARLAEEERKAVLTTIERFERSHAKR